MLLIPEAEWGTIRDMEIDHPPLMICEFLSAKSGEDPPEMFPSKINRCKAGGGLDILPLEKQAELCLGPAHVKCPLRLKAKAAQFGSPLSVAEPLPAGEGRHTTPGPSRGGAKPRAETGKTIELPAGEEFEQLIDFEDAEEPEEEEQPRKRRSKASQEPPSQPFRHEMEDWIRGLFKDKSSD